MHNQSKQSYFTKIDKKLLLTHFYKKLWKILEVYCNLLFKIYDEKFRININLYILYIMFVDYYL